MQCIPFGKQRIFTIFNSDDYKNYIYIKVCENYIKEREREMKEENFLLMN